MLRNCWQLWAAAYVIQFPLCFYDFAPAGVVFFIICSPDGTRNSWTRASQFIFADKTARYLLACCWPRLCHAVGSRSRRCQWADCRAKEAVGGWFLSHYPLNSFMVLSNYNLLCVWYRRLMGKRASLCATFSSPSKLIFIIIHSFQYLCCDKVHQVAVPQRKILAHMISLHLRKDSFWLIIGNTIQNNAGEFY